MRTLWNAWGRITSFPLLWTCAYAAWVALSAGMVFYMLEVGPLALACGVFAAMVAFPLVLLGLSTWMWRANDPDRPRLPTPPASP